LLACLAAFEGKVNLDMGSKKVITLSMDFMRDWLKREMHVGNERLFVDC